ncbi:MAG TPA: hypothetical protein VHX86_09875 [Tepidisphaeraceae bacterium]|jgi:hypothetical protein|nr:hypothetical protein [Tepidisphaeraceae bacterium]
MSELGALGLSKIQLRRAPDSDVELVLVQRPLERILSFTGYSIDNIVDNPIAKHAVIGYYKLSRQVQRRCEIVDLERQWNP